MATRTKKKPVEIPKRKYPTKEDFARPEGIPPLLEIMEIAALLSVSRTTLSKMIRRGTFPAPDIKINGTYPRWNVSTYLTWKSTEEAKRA